MLCLEKSLQVLSATHRMDERHVHRRIYETAQLIIATYFARGLAAGGLGISAIQKNRLMHPRIRHPLTSPTQADADPKPCTFADVLLAMPWDASELGRPISFEDPAFPSSASVE